jgi:hypothetical protein
LSFLSFFQLLELETHFHTGKAKKIKNGGVCIGNVSLSRYYKEDIAKMVAANGYLMFIGASIL